MVIRLARKYPESRKHRILHCRGNPPCTLPHKMVPSFCTLCCINYRTTWIDDWSHIFPARGIWQPLHSHCLEWLWVARLFKVKKIKRNYFRISITHDATHKLTIAIDVNHKDRNNDHKEGLSIHFPIIIWFDLDLRELEHWFLYCWGFEITVRFRWLRIRNWLTNETWIPS